MKISPHDTTARHKDHIKKRRSDWEERYRKDMDIPCGCGRRVLYQIGTDNFGYAIFACNRYMRCLTYNQLKERMTESAYKAYELQHRIDLLERELLRFRIAARQPL